MIRVTSDDLEKLFANMDFKIYYPNKSIIGSYLGEEVFLCPYAKQDCDNCKHKFRFYNGMV